MISNGSINTNRQPLMASSNLSVRNETVSCPITNIEVFKSSTLSLDKLEKYIDTRISRTVTTAVGLSTQELNTSKGGSSNAGKDQIIAGVVVNIELKGINKANWKVSDLKNNYITVVVSGDAFAKCSRVDNLTLCWFLNPFFMNRSAQFGNHTTAVVSEGSSVLVVGQVSDIQKCPTKGCNHFILGSVPACPLHIMKVLGSSHASARMRQQTNIRNTITVEHQQKIVMPNANNNQQQLPTTSSLSQNSNQSTTFNRNSAAPSSAGLMNVSIKQLTSQLSLITGKSTEPSQKTEVDISKLHEIASRGGHRRHLKFQADAGLLSHQSSESGRPVTSAPKISIKIGTNDSSYTLVKDDLGKHCKLELAHEENSNPSTSDVAMKRLYSDRDRSLSTTAESPKSKKASIEELKKIAELAHKKCNEGKTMQSSTSAIGGSAASTAMNLEDEADGLTDEEDIRCDARKRIRMVEGRNHSLLLNVNAGITGSKLASMYSLNHKNETVDSSTLENKNLSSKMDGTVRLINAQNLQRDNMAAKHQLRVAHQVELNRQTAINILKQSNNNIQASANKIANGQTHVVNSPSVKIGFSSSTSTASANATSNHSTSLSAGFGAAFDPNQPPPLSSSFSHLSHLNKTPSSTSAPSSNAIGPSAADNSKLEQKAKLEMCMQSLDKSRFGNRDKQLRSLTADDETEEEQKSKFEKQRDSEKAITDLEKKKIANAFGKGLFFSETTMKDENKKRLGLNSSSASVLHMALNNVKVDNITFNNQTNTHHNKIHQIEGSLNVKVFQQSVSKGANEVADVRKLDVHTLLSSMQTSLMKSVNGSGNLVADKLTEKTESNILKSKLDKLEQDEKLDEMKTSIMDVQVMGWFCQTCKKSRSYFDEVCKKDGHVQVKRSMRKEQYECAKCKVPIERINGRFMSGIDGSKCFKCGHGVFNQVSIFKGKKDSIGSLHKVEIGNEESFVNMMPTIETGHYKEN